MEGEPGADFPLNLDGWTVLLADLWYPEPFRGREGSPMNCGRELTGELMGLESAEAAAAAAECTRRLWVNTSCTDALLSGEGVWNCCTEGFEPDGRPVSKVLRGDACPLALVVCWSEESEPTGNRMREERCRTESDLSEVIYADDKAAWNGDRRGSRQRAFTFLRQMGPANYK